MVKETEFYDTLGIPTDAGENDIKRAYRKMALKYHPDKNPDNAEASEVFKKVGEAYETLSDPEKRKLYDQHGKKGLQEGGGGGFHDASDIFSMFFGGGRRERGDPKPKDIVHELEIPLEDFYNGKIKKIAVTRDRKCQECSCSGVKPNARTNTCRECNGRGVKTAMQQLLPGMVQHVQVHCRACQGQGTSVDPADLCPTCQGNKVVKQRQILEINIERGMKKGDHIRFSGDGDESPSVKLAGDVLILLSQKTHSVFRRVGNHLLMNHTISLQEALCGFKLPVEHLDKRTLLVNVPRGQVIDPNYAWSVFREGMPVPKTGGTERGNLLIHFEVTFPSTLPQKQLAQVSEAFGYEKANAKETGQRVTLQEPKPKPKGRRQSSRMRSAHDEEDEDMGGGDPRMHAQGVPCQQQ